MTNEEGNAAPSPMWQDRYGNKRGHHLMIKKLGDTIPPLYATEETKDTDAVLARVKLFSPYSGWTWYITEWDPKTGTCFGWSRGWRRSWATLTSPSCRR